MKNHTAADRSGVIVFAMACVLAAAVYAPALPLGFVLDDDKFTEDARMQQSAVSVVAANPFRFVVNLSFYFQHRLHRPDLPVMDIKDAAPHLIREEGVVRPLFVTDDGRRVPVNVNEFGIVFPLPPARPFRVANFALHLLCGALLARVARRLGLPPILAGLAGAVLVLHPLATESVNYISARFTLLAAAFSLAAALAHLAADARPRRDFLALGFFLLALFCKESAAPLPVLLFLIDLARGRPTWKPLAGLAVVAAFGIARSQWTIVTGAAPESVLPWGAYVLTEQRVVWVYLLKVLAPVHLTFDYHLAPRPALDAALAALNLALLAAPALLFLRPARPGRRPGAAPSAPVRRQVPAAAVLFPLCWIALTPTMLVPLEDLAREDRAYPLLLVLVPALVAGLEAATRSARRERRLVRVACLAAVLVFLAAGTRDRNRAWDSEVSLYRECVRSSPAKPRTVYNYATALKMARKLPPAMHWYRRALALRPDFDAAAINLRAIEEMLQNNSRDGRGP